MTASSAGAREWLLVLGAGASTGRPTSLPAFPALAAGVLQAIGWRATPTPGGTMWTHGRYPSFSAPDLAPEVLFGTLTRFGLAFAPQIATVLRDRPPNAVHHIAGEVLSQRGIVWTTNVDDAIESACPRSPRRCGPASHLAPDVLAPLSDSAPGMLVKFHGSVEAAHTLAFTDRELLEPLPDAVRAHLAGLAAGRVVVLYGYAGADADLFELLDDVFDRAREILWFEPFARRRSEIMRAFPSAAVRFVPSEVSDDMAAAVRATASAFVDLATDAGIVTDDALLAALLDVRDPPAVPTLRLSAPSAIANARLVERFGGPGNDVVALRQARIDDLRHMRVDALRGHLRWALGLSLYRRGIAAKVVDRLASHRWLLARLKPRRARDYVITRACALRLQQRDWRALEEFACWATRHRTDPSDLYYRAQARRYALRLDEALADATGAAAGLSTARDPERRAGAILELGCVAVSQGRFEDALRAAFELSERTGRYAIPRWRAWGAWLEAVAACHLLQIPRARAALAAARGRFAGEGLAGPVADVRCGELLSDRVALALGRRVTLDVDLSDAEQLGGRYVDDRCLVLADLLLADGDRGAAKTLLQRVAAHPSCPAGAAWADLGLAEIARLDGDPGAGDAFARTARHAAARGAHWLAAQAAIGLELCGDQRAAATRSTLPALVADRLSLSPRGVGDPRVLWMLT